MYLYGKNSIRERLRTNPTSIMQVFLQDGFSDKEILGLIEENNVPFVTRSERKLKKIKSADRLQGIIAEIPKFKYVPIKETLEKKQNIIFLDRINDPHNFGTMIRTAACFGDFAICIPKDGACPITDSVLHVASGGENYVSISLVSNLAAELKKAKENGYKIAGTTVTAKKTLQQAKLKSPVAFILGSEGEGMDNRLKECIDIEVTIPMDGAKLSFNVAMSCSIICYEIIRQNKKI